jgi:hypothetical protein
MRKFFGKYKQKILNCKIKELEICNFELDVVRLDVGEL